MHGVTLYHMYIAEGLEDLVIFIEVGTVTGHHCIAMT